MTVQRCWDAFSCIICDASQSFVSVRVIKPLAGSMRKGVHYPQYIKRMLIEEEPYYGNVGGYLSHLMIGLHIKQQLLTVRLLLVNSMQPKNQL